MMVAGVGIYLLLMSASAGLATGVPTFGGGFGLSAAQGLMSGNFIDS